MPKILERTDELVNYIISHEKTMMFITDCELLEVTESLYNGKVMLAMP